MENNWEPRVGQKVVALVTSPRRDVLNGEIYTCKGIIRCPKCQVIYIFLEEVTGRYDASFCPECRTGLSNDYLPHAGAPSKYFAPIPEQYADMTSEIASQFREHPDTVDQPVKVLEVQN